MTVPEATQFPKVPRPIFRSNSEISSFGNPLGYVWNGRSIITPAISQCPQVVSLAKVTSAERPKAAFGASVCGKRAFWMLPSPSEIRLGICSFLFSLILPSVCAPASPNAAASGCAPMPTLSRTIRTTRFFMLIIMPCEAKRSFLFGFPLTIIVTSQPHPVNFCSVSYDYQAQKRLRCDSFEQNPHRGKKSRQPNAGFQGRQACALPTFAHFL